MATELCMDCGVDTFKVYEYYMLRDILWQEVQPDVCGMLCIGCVEHRLGRRLIPTDFIPDVPLNSLDHEWSKSERLVSRLTGGVR